jgi:hypothetical protein
MPRSDKVPGSGTTPGGGEAKAGIELARMPPNPTNASKLVFFIVCLAEFSLAHVRQQKPYHGRNSADFLGFAIRNFAQA